MRFVVDDCGVAGFDLGSGAVVPWLGERGEGFEFVAWEGRVREGGVGGGGSGTPEAHCVATPVAGALGGEFLGVVFFYEDGVLGCVSWSLGKRKRKRGT